MCVNVCIHACCIIILLHVIAIGNLVYFSPTMQNFFIYLFIFSISARKYKLQYIWLKEFVIGRKFLISRIDIPFFFMNGNFH